MTPLWSEGAVFAVAKPPGLPCFPPHADPAGDCVLRRLVRADAVDPDLDWPPGFDGGIAHRLDVPTSGQLLVARTPAALAQLRARFADKALDKRYRFLTRKAVPWTTHDISRRIAHDRRKGSRVIVERGRNTPHRGRWRDARTWFAWQAQVADGLHLWEARMHTGVMHQIRAHAGAVGLALAGDRLYGGGAPLEFAPAGVPFALHHLGLSGQGLAPTPCPMPAWWPQARGGSRPG